jgi:DNA-binding response OmpR family regulator
MINTGFPDLDSLVGGLREKKSYLAYGNFGVGKTAFALGFLHQGLQAGERCALVSGRLPRALFDMAQIFGLELESYFRDRRLLLFEYPDNVLEHSSRLLDDSRIAKEFRALLGSDPVERVVFDPVTPLLAGPSRASSLARTSAMVESFDELDCTILYVVDLPDGERYLSTAKDLVCGVFCFEPGLYHGAPKRLTIERYPDYSGVERKILYDVGAGAGLIAVTPSEAPPPVHAGRGRPALPLDIPRTPGPMSRLPRTSGNGYEDACRALIVDSDPERRGALRRILESACPVLEAQSAAEGLALTATESPRLIVLAQETHGASGLEIARKLRQNGKSTPIVMIGDHLQRAGDHAAAMCAGVDVCLETPVDGRLLRLHIRNLLRRPHNGPAAAAADTFLPPAREALACTGDLDYFLDCVGRETEYSSLNGISFSVLAFRISAARQLEELTAAATLVARSHDLCYAGTSGVALLLPEAKQAQPLLSRFRQRWKADPPPLVDERRFDGQDNFLESVGKLVVELTGSPALRRGAGGSSD